MLGLDVVTGLDGGTPENVQQDKKASRLAQEASHPDSPVLQAGRNSGPTVDPRLVPGCFHVPLFRMPGKVWFIGRPSFRTVLTQLTPTIWFARPACLPGEISVEDVSLYTVVNLTKAVHIRRLALQ